MARAPPGAARRRRRDRARDCPCLRPARFGLGPRRQLQGQQRSGCGLRHAAAAGAGSAGAAGEPVPVAVRHGDTAGQRQRVRAASSAGRTRSWATRASTAWSGTRTGTSSPASPGSRRTPSPSAVTASTSARTSATPWTRPRKSTAPAATPRSIWCSSTPKKRWRTGGSTSPRVASRWRTTRTRTR